MSDGVKVPLELDIPTLNLVMEGLAELPFKRSYELIAFLRAQGQAALIRAGEAARQEADKGPPAAP